MTKLAKPRLTKEESYGWESGRDLTQVKLELNELLRKQKHKIIIFIDNIARIEDNEIKQIFQIAKSMGDYINTVYVLAIDKTHIIQSMNRIYGSNGNGAEYLEKVVQLPFDVPEISKQNLENILLDRLRQLVDTAVEGSWNNDYWADLYYSTIKYFFEDCRDITRYVNTLSFGFDRVKDLVNPVDFFAIMAINVFEPRVFYGIRDNKDLFSDFVKHVFEEDPDKLIENKLRCDEILSRAEHISQELLLPLLIRLFPQLRSIYQETIPFYHDEELARRNRRICSADVFDIYFRLSLPAGYMSDAELNALLSLTHDENLFEQAILRLNKDERIKEFLDSLDSMAVNKIDKQNIGNVVNALINSADLFPEGESNPLKFNSPMRIHRILHQLLLRLNTANERFEIFREAIEKATMSIYILVHELNYQTKQHVESEDTYVPEDQRDFTFEQLNQLKKLTMAKIQYWAEIGRLAEHPKLIDILYAWKAWGAEEDCLRFVGLMVQEDQGLIAFLCCALQEPISQAMTKLAKNPEWQNALGNVEAFISVHTLEPHAKKIFEGPAFETLRETEQLAILIFLDLIHADTIKVIPKTTV